MRFSRRTASRNSPLISVVVPVYNVSGYLASCLETIGASSHERLEIIVVNDGSTDDSGLIADDIATKDPRIRVIHTENHGLGAARNEGARHASGEYLTFADSDDLVPPNAYAVMLKQLIRSGSDFVTGSIVRWEGEDRVQPPWMARLHKHRQALVIDDFPEILGDVFAWNKLFKRTFWDQAGLSWPEGIRYEDQPTTTNAYLRARRFSIVPDVVYVWRIRTDGSSITQQRSSLQDLQDRWRTKEMALASIEAYGATKVTDLFRDRVLAGDLHRYFTEIPGCPDDWWELLASGVQTFWGERSLTHSGLPPIHRLTGWLVEQGRREDAAAVMTWFRDRSGEPVPWVHDPDGVRIDVPVIDRRTIDPAALHVRDYEV